ncbi:SDR family oxidoreductase [Halomonas sp. G15]|uniref:UDP-glucose 4-epimerase family protein n=1 Tax=Halomonas sp. G15 TaxID=2903521 RepID=UPI001E3CEC9C|nr:SDR family oxidoreductase [Halomonas sp. G15]MCE0734469.1 SDR family oxidoreductase [Halomonas sp. G15]
MTQRVLVTGATGFVGGAVVEKLKDNGRYVPVAGSRRSVSVTEGVELAITPSLGPNADWSVALRDVEVVVHAAARAHIMNETSANQLAMYRKINVDGTLTLARQAVVAGVRRFIFLSSIGVNGNHSTRLFSESDEANPQEAYALSKYEAEKGLLRFAEDVGMEVVIIRPPLVYGPCAPGNFGRLLKWVASGVPLPLGAVRHNRRSLVARDNLVDLIVLCLDHPKAANQVFLASDGEDLSTTELLRRLATAMGRPPRLLPVPVKLLKLGAGLLRKGHIAQRLCGNLQVDITKTRERLGWTPPVSVDQALRETAAAYLASQQQ